MTYTLIILVDGQKVSSNINASAVDVAALCELQGPDLWDFRSCLRLTGKAIDVRNDGYGTVVTIAYQEIHSAQHPRVWPNYIDNPEGNDA